MDELCNIESLKLINPRLATGAVVLEEVVVVTPLVMLVDMFERRTIMDKV